jgi:hypothetical protein
LKRHQRLPHGRYAAADGVAETGTLGDCLPIALEFDLVDGVADDRGVRLISRFERRPDQAAEIQSHCGQTGAD